MASGERLRGVPAWAWLALLVVASAAIRLWLVRGMPAPFVFVDELIYGELAKSLAAGDGYAVRELSDERLQPALPGAHRPCLLALRRACPTPTRPPRRSEP